MKQVPLPIIYCSQINHGPKHTIQYDLGIIIIWEFLIKPKAARLELDVFTFNSAISASEKCKRWKEGVGMIFYGCEHGKNPHCCSEKNALLLVECGFKL